jgi:3-oxo-5-alpha-steroid 4-dehydrogenase 1
MGKTSTGIPGNVPGKLGWLTMEAPGFIILLTIMVTLPGQLGIEKLPWENWTMAAVFVSTSAPGS